MSQVRSKRLYLGKFAGEKHSLSAGIANHKGNNNIRGFSGPPETKANRYESRSEGQRAGEKERTNLNDTITAPVLSYAQGQI